jgi:hypothetical protein
MPVGRGTASHAVAASLHGCVDFLASIPLITLQYLLFFVKMYIALDISTQI